MKKKFSKIMLVAFMTVLFISAFSFFNVSNVFAEDPPGGFDPGECKWATRETSDGWEAICISSGVGYVCTCGEVKPYY